MNNISVPHPFWGGINWPEDAPQVISTIALFGLVRGVSSPPRSQEACPTHSFFFSWSAGRTASIQLRSKHADWHTFESAACQDLWYLTSDLSTNKYPVSGPGKPVSTNRVLQFTQSSICLNNQPNFDWLTPDKKVVVQLNNKKEKRKNHLHYASVFNYFSVSKRAEVWPLRSIRYVYALQIQSLQSLVRFSLWLCSWALCETLFGCKK